MQPDPDSTDPAIDDLPLIKVVGISASGKSTLVQALRQRGYKARPVSQEHSNVADLWQQFDEPQYLFYLDADLATQGLRRPDVSWDKAWHREEGRRLLHARGHANLIIDTSGLVPEQVLQIALTYLIREKVRHADRPLPPVTPTGTVIQPPPAPPPPTQEEDDADAVNEKQRSNRTQRRLDKRAQHRQQRKSS